MLPRAAYFQTLAAIAGPKNSEWHSVVAGLVALRLVDDWLDFGPHILSEEHGDLVAVRHLIARIPDSYLLQSLLGRIVDAVERTKQISIAAVTPPLLDYAAVLREAGKLSLSQDVLEPLKKRAEEAKHTKAIIQTSMHLAKTLRIAGQYDLALMNYDTAIYHAGKSNDRASVIHASLGRALVAMTQGDSAFAETVFADAIVETSRIVHMRLLSYALEDQGLLAMLHGEYQRSIGLLHRALEHSIDTHDYIELNLAGSLIYIGRLQQACDINARLAVTSQSQIVRWSASISLMYQSIVEKQQAAFELYCAALRQSPLPPNLAVLYRLNLIEGYTLFGDRVQAETELTSTRIFAEQHKIHIGYWV